MYLPASYHCLSIARPTFITLTTASLPLAADAPGLRPLSIPHWRRSRIPRRTHLRRQTRLRGSVPSSRSSAPSSRHGRRPRGRRAASGTPMPRRAWAWAKPTPSMAWVRQPTQPGPASFARLAARRRHCSVTLTWCLPCYVQRRNRLATGSSPQTLARYSAWSCSLPVGMYCSLPNTITRSR